MPARKTSITLETIFPSNQNPSSFKTESGIPEYEFCVFIYHHRARKASSIVGSARAILNYFWDKPAADLA
jgi:hypothetical protein